MDWNVEAFVKLGLFFIAASLFVKTVLLAGLADAQSAQRKFDVIEHGTAKAGTAISLTQVELESWMKEEAKYWVPQGVRDLRLSLAEGRAVGFARIDFLKLKQAGGEQPGYLMRMLLAGERPVTVTVRFLSRNGQARVDVERVEISGIPLEGAGLEFLIQSYLWATFPDARAGAWFPLEKHVDHFAVHESGATVVMK